MRQRHGFELSNGRKVSSNESRLVMIGGDFYIYIIVAGLADVHSHLKQKIWPKLEGGT